MAKTFEGKHRALQIKILGAENKQFGLFDYKTAKYTKKLNDKLHVLYQKLNYTQGPAINIIKSNEYILFVNLLYNLVFKDEK